MQTYSVRLESPVATTFRCQRAADALDIDTKKKSVHAFSVDADLLTPYNVGLIVGASGSGKTTLATAIFGPAALARTIDDATPIIDQFPKAWSYDQCAAALVGVGLTSVPCWIRPVYTLSNGQRARAEAALLLAREMATPTVVDEWTSVVDRTVAKVMSHCVQKHARRSDGKLVLLSCHYDVIDWINPDWIIDCNTATYTNRRGLWQGFRRHEQLTFDIREVDRRTWRAFSKYHYLSDRLPGGQIYTFGLFAGATQVGFQCFANYTPTKPGMTPIFHSNRTVVHPDYAGLGLGMRVITLTSEEMLRRGVRVMAKYSSTPVYRAMVKDPAWRFLRAERIMIMKPGGNMLRDSGFREQVKTYHFEFIGAARAAAAPPPDAGAPAPSTAPAPRPTAPAPRARSRR